MMAVAVVVLAMVVVVANIKFTALFGRALLGWQGREGQDREDWDG